MDSARQNSGVFWVETRTLGRLAILRRPASAEALAEVVADWRSAGIGTVVCLMEEGELRRLGLDGEGDACRRAGIDFIACPIADFGVPRSMAEVEPLLRQLGAKLRRGGCVGVHCQQSVGRSGLISAALLVALGFEPIEAFQVISKSRGVSVPETSAQRRWIEGSKPALRALAL